MFAVLEEIILLLRAALTTSYTTYYLGNVKTENIAGNYLPALIVYGNETELLTDQLTTARDKYAFNVTIKVVVNALGNADEAEPTNTNDSNVVELQTQKQLYNLVEERDSDMKPLTATILGVLRANVSGTDYLFHNNVVIEYFEENVGGTQYHIAMITLQNITRYNSR
ncbi:MAG: hypothetical protein V3T43_06150 [Nitrosomonadaceae bacterium]